MSHQILKEIASPESLSSQLAAVDHEFKDFLTSLTYRREFGPNKLKTFSPLDAVEDFSQDGLGAVVEITREEMMGNNTAFNKVLANMFAQCQPGVLTEDEVRQISGINGRELQATL